MSDRPRQVVAPYVDLILDSVADGVFTVDPEFRITYFNSAAERITGFSAGEVVGKLCERVFRPAICQRQCPMRQSLRDGRRVEGVDIEAWTAGGEPILINVSTAPLVGADGRFLGGVETFRDRTPMRALRRELAGRHALEDMVCCSQKMSRVLSALPALARSDDPVLLLGGRGTLKRRMVQAMHDLSIRRDGPMEILACMGLPEAALRPELVGQVALASERDPEERTGRLQEADGGTLYIEDVERLSLPLQEALLRAIETGEVEPFGLGRAVEVDVRVMAGSTQDLSALVKEGRFSAELLRRLAPAALEIPPLHQRTEDIPVLAEDILRRLEFRRSRGILALSEDALASLMEYPFPGNVVELERALEHAYIVAHGPDIHPEDLPAFITVKPERSGAGPRPGTSADKEASRLEPAEAERLRILRCLQRNYWSMSRAAQELGMHRSTLWRKVRRLGIQRP